VSAFFSRLSSFTADLIELWRITPTGAPNVEAFIVEDRKRTPETWQFRTRVDADAKFEERLEFAKTHPPVTRG